MPLQLERTWQFVHALAQHFHHAIIAAINVDFASPDGTRSLNLHQRVGCSNRGAAHQSKTFAQPLNKPRSIVIPLIAIVFANEVFHSLPVSAVDRVKEMFRVQTDLMLGSPKPHEIQPGAKGKSYPAKESGTKCNCHKPESSHAAPTASL